MFMDKKNYFLSIRRTGMFALLACILYIGACNSEGGDDGSDPEGEQPTEEEENPDGEEPEENEFLLLLNNQVDEIIIVAAQNYETQMQSFDASVETFVQETTSENLELVRNSFDNAYLAYQRLAIHNYFATSRRSLVEQSNLFPADEIILDGLIENQSFDFTANEHRMANGFPAIDLMIFGQPEGIDYFTSNENRVNFLNALVNFLTTEAETISASWTGNLRDNFVNNGGTVLGSSISVQLNQSVVYWEERVREDKVGIPIGRLGPLDTPIPANPSLIEAFNRSQFDGNEDFTLSLVRAAVEEMQRLFTGGEGQGYDDLLINREQVDLVNDINEQFSEIINEIENRSSISGNENLYDAIQEIVTLFKGDLLPILNVQDADAANDGD